MDAKSRNEDRKRAIEAKRKRLEEIRRSKAAVGTSAADAAAPTQVSAQPPAPAGQGAAGNEGLDTLIKQLLEKPSEAEEDRAERGGAVAPAARPEGGSDPASAGGTLRSQATLRRVVELGAVHIPCKPADTYDKGTQTDAPETAEQDDLDSSLTGMQSPLRRSRKATETSSEAAAESRPPPATTAPGGLEEPETAPPSLDAEERACIEREQGFQAFLSQGVRIVERAMKQNAAFDVTIDYGGLDAAAGAAAESLRLVEVIMDERWSKDRTVTEIQSSPHHSELFLAAYGKRQATSELDWSRSSSDPNGVVLVWSSHMATERPEYVFTTQDAVHTAKFHPFAPNIIVGGTYSGQIVVWDLRAKSAPVQRSQLSAESHTHPVYSMAITGTVNAHSLASVSTDGRLCLWSLANVSQPTESRQLVWNKKDITATALAFPDGETNELCVGAEDGRMFRAQVHGTKAGVQSQREAHFGPITRLDFHRGSSSLADLVLSSSMDWTVKLWSQRVGDVPLATFEGSEDYIFDARWSPAHPALFATANGAGMLDLWNINVDLEEPVARVQVASSGACALSSLMWAPGGRQIYVGDARGRVHVYEVASEVAVPRRDEWARLENTVANLVDEAGSLTA